MGGTQYVSGKVSPSKEKNFFAKVIGMDTPVHIVFNGYSKSSGVSLGPRADLFVRSTISPQQLR